MNRLRHLIPILGIIALIALIFMLPAAPNIFGSFKCKTCSSTDFNFTLIAAGYFAILIALSLLFKAFPNCEIARSGFIWAILLAVVLIYIKLPHLCVACLISHACNILIWTIWVRIPFKEKTSILVEGDRFYFALFVPIIVIALFSCLNLTFMNNGFKNVRDFSSTDLRMGDSIPIFSVQTTQGRSILIEDHQGMIINFVSPECFYCKEQLIALKAIATKIKSYPFINISSSLPEWGHNSPFSDWIEDKESKLSKIFKITGYPTLFVVKRDGKIARIISGVPGKFQSILLDTLELERN